MTRGPFRTRTLPRTALLGVAAALALASCSDDPEGTISPVPTAAPSTATTTGTTASSAPPSSGSSPQPTTAPPQTSTAPADSTDPAAGRPAVLSGKREVTIVRVQAFESGLSMRIGELIEVDDDSGRQLFVPTPITGDTYLIKSYGTANGHPANDEPSCWQADNPGNGSSLTVTGAVCDAGDPAQQFKITASGTKAYAISNRSAFLQYSPTSGLILEELGDSKLRSTFRLNDTGPARTPAGG